MDLFHGSQHVTLALSVLQTQLNVPDTAGLEILWCKPLPWQCLLNYRKSQEGKLGMRWRTQQEVVAGKGQFVCGTRGCELHDGLASFEVTTACLLPESSLCVTTIASAVDRCDHFAHSIGALGAADGQACLGV